MSSTTSASVSRRSFVAGAAGVAAATAAASAVGTAALADSAAATDSASSTLSADSYAAAKWDFEIPPAPIEDSAISETKEADVVVVGCGLSGLMTAVSALEEGVSVTIVTASKAPVARGGSNNGIYSKVMEEKGVERFDVDWFYRLQTLANSGNFNTAMWYKHYNNSETAMNWLIDRLEKAGVKTTIENGGYYEQPDPMAQPAASHAFYVSDDELHSQVGMVQHYATDALAQQFQDEGGQIFFQTKAEQLVRDDDNTGRVSAVIASDTDGNYIKFAAAKAVVLATGDFSRDPDMMAKYCPEGAELVNYEPGEIDYDLGFSYGGIMPGDGHKMGLWVGAAWQKTYPNAFMISSAGKARGAYCQHSGLLVNGEGVRFGNEALLGAMGNAAAWHQPKGIAWSIWSHNYASDCDPMPRFYSEIGSPDYTADELIEEWDADDAIVKADTLEELIAQIGLPETTLDTIERYNGFCETGVDEDFHKSASKLVALKEGPFYAYQSQMKFLTVLGGLRTNIDLQVCEEDDTPIEGLYNVGSMIGDFFANIYTYAMEGMCYGACGVTMGYLLGKEVAAL